MITSANSVFTLAILGLFPAPQTLKGYSTDDAFDSDAADIAETRMGVDGWFTGGYVPSPQRQTIHLMADSPSISLFMAWESAEAAIKDILPATGIITLPGLGKSWALSTGILRSVKRIPDARKVLADQAFIIEWGSVIPSPTGN